LALNTKNMRKCVFEMVKNYLSVCIMTLREDLQKITYQYHSRAGEIRDYHNSAEEEPSLLAYDVVYIGILVQKFRWSFLPTCSVYHQPTTGQYATYVRPFFLHVEPSLGLMISFFLLFMIPPSLWRLTRYFTLT